MSRFEYRNGIRFPEIKTTFVPIEKIASSTLRRAFVESITGTPKNIKDYRLEAERQHVTVSWVRKNFPDDFIFAFVRNPYDRLVSFWAGRIKPNQKIELNWWHERGRKFLPQSIFIDEMPDFLGRFENLENDFIRLHKLRNWPYIPKFQEVHMNKHKEWGVFDIYFDSIIALKCYKQFKKDFIRFNYPRLR